MSVNLLKKDCYLKEANAFGILRYYKYTANLQIDPSEHSIQLLSLNQISKNLNIARISRHPPLDSNDKFALQIEGHDIEELRRSKLYFTSISSKVLVIYTKTEEQANDWIQCIQQTLISTPTVDATVFPAAPIAADTTALPLNLPSPVAGNSPIVTKELRSPSSKANEMLEKGLDAFNEAMFLIEEEEEEDEQHAKELLQLSSDCFLFARKNIKDERTQKLLEEKCKEIDDSIVKLDFKTREDQISKSCKKDGGNEASSKLEGPIKKLNSASITSDEKVPPAVVKLDSLQARMAALKNESTEVSSIENLSDRLKKLRGQDDPHHPFPEALPVPQVENKEEKDIQMIIQQAKDEIRLGIKSTTSEDDKKVVADEISLDTNSDDDSLSSENSDEPEFSMKNKDKDKKGGNSGLFTFQKKER